jgi:hypothetical protein
MGVVKNQQFSHVSVDADSCVARRRRNQKVTADFVSAISIASAAFFC